MIRWLAYGPQEFVWRRATAAGDHLPTRAHEHEHTREHTREHTHDGTAGGHASLFHSHTPIERMRTAFLLTLVVFAVELAGGFLSHSLALFSDAGHVLTDIAALGLSWYAMNQARKPANAKMTYGYHRSGILAALTNGATLIVITVIIFWQAVARFQHPSPVAPLWMMLSAGIGLALNLYLGLGMQGDDNINVRSAVLHMLGDAAASAGVIVGAVLIAVTGWNVIDPLLSTLIALLIAAGAWRIVRQTLGILMEGTPQDVDMGKVIATIRGANGVRDVHDVHVWSITAGKNALSCHVVLAGDLTIHDSQAILRCLEQDLVHLGVGHVTIQVEDGEHPHDESVLCQSP